MTKDIYLSSAYIAPEGSPIYDFDIFDKVEREIRHFQSLGGRVFLMGDLNSRTAGKDDYSITMRRVVTRLI